MRSGSGIPGAALSCVSRHIGTERLLIIYPSCFADIAIGANQMTVELWVVPYFNCATLGWLTHEQDHRVWKLER
jgi:hypothetical protein